MRSPINQTLYFVEVDYGRLGHTFKELDRDRNSRACVVEDIVRGEHSDVLTVLEVNPVDGQCRDVTAEIFGEVSFAKAMADIDAVMRDCPQAARFDHVRDLRKHEAAA